MNLLVGVLIVVSVTLLALLLRITTFSSGGIAGAMSKGGSSVTIDTTVSKVAYRMKPGTVELIKAGRLEDAASELSASTGIPKDSALDVVRKAKDALTAKDGFATGSAVQATVDQQGRTKQVLHQTFKLPPEVVTLIKTGEENKAISRIREVTGLSEDVAKQIVSSLKA